MTNTYKSTTDDILTLLKTEDLSNIYIELFDDIYIKEEREDVYIVGRTTINK